MPEIPSVTGVGGNDMFTSNKDIGGVSQQDFLQLLIAQLQHQDPMEPQDSQQFAAQLAQFSSLEQLQSLNNTSEQGVETNLMLTQTINNTMAATMVGKDVKALGNSLVLGHEGQPSISFQAGAYADNVDITIMDAAGQVVDTVSMQAVTQGDHTLTWDASKEDGSRLPPGEYTFTVSATNGAGEEIPTDAVMIGTIDAVRYTSSGAIFVVNGKEVPFTAVLELGQFNPDDQG